MTVAEKIRRNLVNLLQYTEGEANAAQIYKGHGRDGWGWYVRPFGEDEQFFGGTYIECLATLDDLEEARQYNHPVGLEQF